MTGKTYEIAIEKEPVSRPFIKLSCLLFSYIYIYILCNQYCCFQLSHHIFSIILSLHTKLIVFSVYLIVTSWQWCLVGRVRSTRRYSTQPRWPKLVHRLRQVIYLCIYVVCIFLCIYLYIYLYIYLSIYVSIYLSIYLSMYLSI